MTAQPPAPFPRPLASREQDARSDPDSPPAGPRFDAEALRHFTLACLVATGVAAEEAAIVAECLVDASLRGVDTHGVATLLPAYLAKLRGGGYNPRPRIRVVEESASTALLDGDDGLGALVAMRAMELAMAKARAVGFAWVGARRSNHLGALGYYPRQAARQGMVGLGFSPGVAAMAPWGGRRPYLSSNPLALALPAGPEPIVLDMATSIAARGNMLVAAARGEPIPPGWALDREGRPTTDPVAALAGMVLPVGGHKGYGLSLVVDLLAGVLVGAANGPRIGPTRGDPARPQYVGHLFAALDVARFLPLAAFEARVAAVVEEIRALPLAPGFDRILVPGERSAEIRRQRLAHGVPLPAASVAELRAAGAELGVAFPAPLDGMEVAGPA